MNYYYTIEYVAGPQNIWAHMISRWAGNYTNVSIKQVRGNISSAVKTALAAGTSQLIPPLRRLGNTNFVWFTFAELTTVQHQHKPPAQVARPVDEVLALDDRLWVSVEAPIFIQRLFVIVCLPKS